MHASACDDMPDLPQHILAIDPGRYKCGLAILTSDCGVVQKLTVKIDEVANKIADLIGTYNPTSVCIGDGTGSGNIVRLVGGLYMGTVSMVPERGTTLEARELSWLDSPPKGLYRLLPHIFWPTPKDLDAWAAVVIGRRYLSK
jgi:RNase H-fold protein (predicted Holliday junction resolvase)